MGVAPVGLEHCLRAEEGFVEVDLDGLGTGVLLHALVPEVAVVEEEGNLCAACTWAYQRRRRTATLGVVGAGVQKPEMHDLGVQKIPETKAKQKVRIANSSLTEDIVDGVHGDLVLGGVPNEPLRVDETNV